MAWPLSRIISFVANSVPVIGAAFLNSIQDALIGAFTGTVSFFAIVVDGVGGQAATPAAGTVTVRGAIGTSAAGDGVLYRDLCAFATGTIKFDATILKSANVATVTTPGTGNYVVTTRACPTWAQTLADGTSLNLPLLVQINTTGTLLGIPTFPQLPIKTTVGGVPVVTFTVKFLDPSNNPVNQGFSFVLYP